MKKLLVFLWVLLFPIVVWAAPQTNTFGSDSPIFNLSYNAVAGALQVAIVGRGITSPQTNTYGSTAQIMNQVYNATDGALQVYLDSGSIDELFTATDPELLLYNTTEEDTDGGRESLLRVKGEQSGGEVTTLATVTFSHDGSSDDEKGKIILATNDGNDATTPSQKITIDSAGQVGVGTIPETPLHIDNVSGSGIALLVAGGNTGGKSQIRLEADVDRYRTDLQVSTDIFRIETYDSTGLDRLPLQIYGKEFSFLSYDASTPFSFQSDGSPIVTIKNTGSSGFGGISPDTMLDINGALTIREKSVDPSDPDEGSTAIWMSDGTGAGDDGDVMLKITAGGSTKTITLVDFSAF